MTVTTINSFDEFKQVISSGIVVAIDFWAAWCGPCRTVSPIFEKLSESVSGIEFYKVDVDSQQEISQEVGIKAMPTFMVFKNGEQVDELVGAHAGQLEQLLVKNGTFQKLSISTPTVHPYPHNVGMTVTAINSLDEFKQVINSGKVVAIDFWAAWCSPCRAISPVFEKLSGTVTGVEFYKVDVDSQQEISQEANIRFMPTFIVFKDGEKIEEMVGADPQKLHQLLVSVQ